MRSGVPTLSPMRPAVASFIFEPNPDCLLGLKRLQPDSGSRASLEPAADSTSLEFAKASPRPTRTSATPHLKPRYRLLRASGTPLRHERGHRRRRSGRLSGGPSCLRYRFDHKRHDSVPRLRRPSHDSRQSDSCRRAFRLAMRPQGVARSLVLKSSGCTAGGRNGIFRGWAGIAAFALR
jgi:hypothetical protein